MSQILSFICNNKQIHNKHSSPY